MSEKLSPLFKWTGGKRKEIKHIAPLLPSFVNSDSKYTYVEPFVGAGALYWWLNNLKGKNIINDYDFDVTNFYRQVSLQDKNFLKQVKLASALFEDKSKHDAQEAMYYKWRNMDRGNGLDKLSDSDRAARFWIVNQLAFSGMRRFNSSGEFNVPFGHYKNLNCQELTNNFHVNLLQKTKVVTGDYKKVILANDKPDTFMFIDPPYTRVMKTYSAENEFGDVQQEELGEVLKNLQHAKFMIVIDKSPLTEKIYKNNIKTIYELSYGVNIRNRFDTKVEHIVATNY